jgi:hypothetical protein
MSPRLRLVTSPGPSVSGAVSGAQVRSHSVVGDPDQVWAAMARARADGRLVSLNRSEELPGGLVRVTVDLVDPTPTGRWRQLRPWLVVSAVLVGVAAAAALVWLVLLAVLAVVAAVTAAVVWVQAHLLVIGVVALALVLLLGAGGASCAGSHCGGCRR